LVFIVWLIGKGGVILILPFFYLHLKKLKHYDKKETHTKVQRQ